MKKLDGRVALVTGAAQGIGEAIAIALAEHGANIAVNDVNLSGAPKVAEAIEALGREAMAVIADVSQGLEVERMVIKVLDRFGRIDILVNNAGIDHMNKLEDLTEEEWDLTLGVNLKGAFLCSKAVFDRMVQQRYGRMVNIASMGAHIGSPWGQIDYVASKTGMLGLTRCFAEIGAKYNITANTIAPGFIDTELLRRNVTGSRLEEAMEMIPLGRLGSPKEVAEVVVFLVCAHYITGETININGGAWMA